ncbi:hypothetical protein BV20DRAFT_672240 [Pilatotrama ljubarskyi]|nr:hypothetical protein BV20DRAFT_672240 [Pilatotrama ljubarskyi]
MADSAACRILVISPSATRAVEFVERVQALAGSRTASPAQIAGSPAETVGDVGTSLSPTLGRSKDLPSAGDGSSTVPWTIVNKYYTADVHFETHEFNHFRVRHAVGVPAVIYVWGPGEPYKEHIPEIAQKIQHYDPEVSLAVRFGGSTTPSSPTAEDEGLDEFLSTHGFEFVEGDRVHRRPTQDLDRHSDDEDSGIPGLPRVIDALSTIMWPSLVQSQAARQRKSRARELLGWALEEEADDGLRALIADPVAAAPTTSSPAAPTAAGTSATANARKSRMQREMEELERWLEDEEAGSGLQYAKGQTDGKPVDPVAAEKAEMEDEGENERAREWVSSAPATSAEGWEDMLTPPAIRTPRAEDEHPAVSEEEHGFEDDFADFVSATSDSHLHAHSHVFGHGFGLGHGEGRLLEVNYDVGRLTPMHTGASYRSLASVSDFGGDEGAHGGGYGALGDEEDDPDLPSQAEIRETSRRLFGAAAFAPAPEAAASSTSSEPRPSSSTAPASESLSPRREDSSSRDADSSADLSLDCEDADDHSFASFDLSRVFSALQGMKAEIAGMEDEDERRRAAARVALGLVYGLGVSRDGPEPDPSHSSEAPTHA